ncbi:CLUMA_CG013984, isoform B [Clunio marinus]|uniref:CLUMA_CG013984, isoform B n=1 Tax=Clunio marinus TaxID=568069 RepID=A0A1J1IKM6_9DIPT|nr:CLUMA_CG013984, isoform B [Clunio marinus]
MSTLNVKQESKEKMPLTRTEMRPVRPAHYADSFWATYIISVAAASVAEFATYPLDLTKTRLQIQGEAASVAGKTAIHRGMIQTAVGIVREEGATKLFQGLTPALYRHVVYSGVRIVTYDILRKKFVHDSETLTLWKSAVAGVTAGGLAQFLASPADLVKVHIQMEGKRRLMGLEPRVHSASHAFKEIVKRGGVKALWKGSVPNVQRAALVNLGDLTTYDSVKRYILKSTGWPDDHLVHIMSSICAGFVAAIMGTPADVVKTRVMNQPTDNLGRPLSPPHYADSFWGTYLISVASASVAESVTYPLDLTKTRLQVQGEGYNHAQNSKIHHRGMLQTAFGIIREEGATKLWQGITPALYRHVVYTGVRIATYDIFRKKFVHNSESMTLGKAAIAGVTAGGLAQFLASPADLVKVHIQMEGKRRLMGLEPRVHSASHAFKEIVKRGGVKALWKGSVPNVQRAALVNLGDLTTYDSVKRYILKSTGWPDDHLVHIMSSICAGFVAAIMGTPADVVKTRVMNQPTDNLGRGLLYKGSLDCLQQTIKREGMLALYKGFLPCWIRMAPWSLTFWLSFEQIRKSLDVDEIPFWVEYTNNVIPKFALKGGMKDDETIYIGRALHNGALTPGSVVSSENSLYLAWGYQAHRKTNFEILVGGSEDNWVASKGGHVPENAFVAGYTELGESLFIGRQIHNERLLVGKIHPSFYLCYIPDIGGTKELEFNNYEVLVDYNMKSVIPVTAGILSVGVLIYLYIKRREKGKKTNDSDDNQALDPIEELEFKVKNQQVPAIIGRNSVILKSIEEKTQTTIRFRVTDENNQMCLIKGKRNNVKAAKQLIEVEASKPCIITDEILVPTSSCGKIEGYSGSILHEICSKSSAKVWVDPGSRKNQAENRRVLITGTEEQVQIAKKLIEEKIKEEQPVDNDNKKDDFKREPRLSSPGQNSSNSSLTVTDSAREIMLPSPEKLKNNDGQLEVFVSALNSPSRFWLQLVGPQSTELDFLVDAMTEYYSDKSNQELHQIREPYLGQIVAAMFFADNKWYRAEIVAIQVNKTLPHELLFDVYFLDYGDNQFVSKKDILELRADFLSLRFQAIECFLAHVQPSNNESKLDEWDEKSVEKFEELVQPARWKKLISKVVAYKDKKSFAFQRQSKQRESSPIPGVELYDPDDNSDKNIALELVKLGHAEMTYDFGDLKKSSILKPTEDEMKEKKDEKSLPFSSNENEAIQIKIKENSPPITEENPSEDLYNSPIADLPQQPTNGISPSQSQQEPSSIFNDGKKKKKNKKNQLNEFLENEQQTSNSSSKVDWNTMMED